MNLKKLYETYTNLSPISKASVTIGILVIISLATLNISQRFVTAQQAVQSLEVSPPLQDVSIDPGKVLTVKAKVRNPGDKTLPITARIENFVAQGDEGQVSLTADETYSVKSWTKLEPEKFTLKPGQEQEVVATITVPAEAAGARYGTFIFGVDTGEAKKGSAAVSQQIASLFLVRISGPANETLTLSRFEAPKFLEYGPVPFSISAKNTGNVHTKMYGLVNVTNIFGQKVADLVVQGTNVFPDATRVVNVNLDKYWLFGPYTATAIMYYGSANPQTLTASTTIFVFPVKLAAGILIGITIIFVLRKRLKKAGKALFGK